MRFLAWPIFPLAQPSQSYLLPIALPPPLQSLDASLPQSLDLPSFRYPHSAVPSGVLPKPNARLSFESNSPDVSSANLVLICIFSPNLVPKIVLICILRSNKSFKWPRVLTPGITFDMSQRPKK